MVKLKAYLKVNIIIGFTAFFITGLFSLVNNTWQLSLFRAGIGFLLFFILGNILTFFLYQNLSKSKAETTQTQKVNENRINISEMKEQVEEITLTESGDKLVNESSFQAIPLQSLHNGEEARN